MRWYCEKCRTFHEDGELCPKMRYQLRKNPELLAEAANFTSIAGQYELITSQRLDGVAAKVNQIAGTNLSYEGTHQFARDIRVFKRLSEESMKKAFESPEKAQNYLENVLKLQKKAELMGETDGRKLPLQRFDAKLTGYSQEVDWEIFKRSKLSSIWQKSRLYNGNYPGVDGETVNRFTGKLINRTTIKASTKPMDKNSTGIRGVKDAIQKGYATSDDVLFAPEGAEAAARDAGLTNPVEQYGTPEGIQNSNERLRKKILDGQAVTSPTAGQVASKMTEGAVVGAAVGLTVSAITNYLRYKNGELSIDEAFRDTSEDAAKSAIVGGALAGITIFIPGGPIGFIAGMAVGVYVDAVCGNILDDVFGKGRYGAILDASGYVYGMTMNLESAYELYMRYEMKTDRNIAKTRQIQEATDDVLRRIASRKHPF